MGRLKTGQPTIGVGWELKVIAGVVVGGISLLGGAGSMLGTLIGMTILFVVENGLVVINVNPHWQTVAIGLVMILAVMVDMARRTGKLDARRWLALLARIPWLRPQHTPEKGAES
jgi:ribose transport system permease protein